jgi:hypothetical protein
MRGFIGYQPTNDKRIAAFGGIENGAWTMENDLACEALVGLLFFRVFGVFRGQK